VSDWRSWARIGLWSYVDLDGLLQEENPEELAELRAALEDVVPVIPPDEAGVSLLTERRRARVQDVAFLTKHAKQGDFVKAMRQVKARYANIRDPDMSPRVDQLLARAKERAGGDMAFQVEQLRYAALRLEEMDIQELEEMRPQHMERPWRAAVEQAHKSLTEAGIAFIGLRDTIVDIDVGTRKVTPAAADPKEWRGLTKRELLKRLQADGVSRVSLLELTAIECPAAGSEVWHAACLLSLAEAADLEMSHLAASPNDQAAGPPEDVADPPGDEVADPSEDAEPWSDDEVLAKVQEVAALALELGRHFHALDASWLEQPAAKHFAVTAAREKAAAARRGVTEQTSRVLVAMDAELAAMNRPNVSQAARFVAKKGIGRSAEANRALYYAHRRSDSQKVVRRL
jgi:hypothetical protein